MEQSKKLYFIYNPRSGKEQIRTKLYDIIQVFSEAGYELTVCPTKEPKDAVWQIEHLSDVYDLVVCSGGDGTLDEVVQGMMLRDKPIPLGYIPAGTVNDFARSLNIPRNMAEAAALAVNGKDFLCDIGSFNDDYFVYIAAFGMFTDVAYSTNQDLKNVLGHMAYLLEGVKRLPNVPTYHLRIESEELETEGDFIFGMVTNSRSVGGLKSVIGQQVDFSDGLFEVTLIRLPKNITELQEIAASIVSRELNSKYIHSFRTANLKIEAEVPMAWTLDGEFGGDWQHVEIRNHQKALPIRIEA